MSANKETDTPYRLHIHWIGQTCSTVIPIKSYEEAESIVKDRQVAVRPTITVNGKVVAIVRGDL